MEKDLSWYIFKQVPPDKNVFPISTLPCYLSEIIPMTLPLQQTLLHPVTAITIDLHHTVLTQRLL